MRVHRCVRCGAAGEAPVDGMPLAWSVVHDEQGHRLLCERCTREHVRDIESKLDEDWWA